MLDDTKLEAEVRDLLMDICEVLARRGYEVVSVSAMMRLVGVGDERAAAHEGEFFALDEEFWSLLSQREQDKNLKKVQRHSRDGVTLH